MEDLNNLKWVENWPGLKYYPFYRTIMVLPIAVMIFLSIWVGWFEFIYILTLLHVTIPYILTQ
jgi:hypothetical protein